MGFSEGVTVGAGFPYAISTPAHGTAFDIARQRRCRYRSDGTGDYTCRPK
ncbi:MAG: 4-hydroxythreonine-4-phosphate dehydrogenase PdxA [bacterium]